MADIDKVVLEKWKHNPTTIQIWERLKKLYQTNAWRVCDLDKIEYHRGQAAMMEELEKFFDPQGDTK